MSIKSAAASAVVSIKAWPWKIIAIAGAGVLLFALMGWTLHRAKADGIAQGRAEIQRQWSAEKAGRANARAELSAALTQAFHGLDGTLQATVGKITADGRTIRVQVEQELKNDPRYTAAECSLSDRLRDEINAARGLSRPPGAADVRSVPVPAGGAAVRLEFGDAGPR